MNKSINIEVTVIMPAYNSELYLSQAINSTLNQTFNNIEIIIINDASTDGTLAIAKSFTDQRLKIITTQKNAGAAAARNLGLQSASGKWIALLDADDWYSEERLEALLRIANIENPDMIADDLFYIKDKDKLPWTTLLNDSSEKIDQIKTIDPLYFLEIDLPGKSGLTLGLTKPLIKREFLMKHQIEYAENIRLGQDFWFYLKCLGYGAKFIFVPQAYYFYRSHHGSLVCQSKVERLNQYITAGEDFLKQEFITKDPLLVSALSKRLQLIAQSRSYFTVIDAYRSGNILKTMLTMIRHPNFLIRLFQNLPKKFLRLKKYFLFSKSFGK
jgi:succinoglycan biosynthesis protein ExoO